MKVYTGTDATIDPMAIAEFARRAEAAGYDVARTTASLSATKNL